MKCTAGNMLLKIINKSLNTKTFPEKWIPFKQYTLITCLKNF